MKTSSIILVLLPLGIAVAACGDNDAQAAKSSASGTTSPAKKAAVEVCSLLTSEEIAEATGAKVAEIKADAYGAVGTCNYQVANELLPVVSLLLAPSMPPVSSSSDMAQWRSKQAGSYGDIKFVIEPIEGLGVPAIRNQIEGVDMVTVEAAAKGRLLDVTTSSLEKSKALAVKAMARLP